MIIGINGKIGSGKDTVGSIIQYLTTHPKSNGKTDGGSINRSYGSYLIDIGCGHEPDWEIKKFAGKLKTIASLLTGIPVEKFEDQEFKKTYLGKEWNSPYNIPFSGPDFVKHDGEATVREFLQKLGTEAMRDGLHTNVWVNALFADYKPLVKEWDDLGNDTLVEYPNWIITDMRFENELEAVVKHKGIAIRVVRPKGLSEIAKQSHYTLSKDGLVPTYTEHPSETALDGFIMHYEIINDGTIEDLVEKVREILITEKII
jgi:hypothetical protein